MKRVLLYLSLIIVMSSFSGANTLKGTWEFASEVSNGKREGASAEYAMQRKYDKKHFEAFLLEKGSKPERYEAGDYILKGDTCYETETYSSQPSKLTGITIHYFYVIRNDTLIMKGTLPNGRLVEEYWKRIR